MFYRSAIRTKILYQNLLKQKNRINLTADKTIKVLEKSRDQPIYDIQPTRKHRKSQRVWTHGGSPHPRTVLLQAVWLRLDQCMRSDLLDTAAVR